MIVRYYLLPYFEGSIFVFWGPSMRDIWGPTDNTLTERTVFVSDASTQLNLQTK